MFWFTSHTQKIKRIQTTLSYCFHCFHTLLLPHHLPCYQFSSIFICSLLLINSWKANFNQLVCIAFMVVLSTFNKNTYFDLVNDFSIFFWFIQHTCVCRNIPGTVKSLYRVVYNPTYMLNINFLFFNIF